MQRLRGLSLIDDAPAWYELASSIISTGRYLDAKVGAPAPQAYGALVTHLWGPSGVLLHLAQWNHGKPAHPWLLKGGDVDNSRRSGIVPLMILTLDAKRRLTVPTNLVSAQRGDNLEAVFDPEDDAVILRRLCKNTNWLAVLMAVR